MKAVFVLLALLFSGCVSVDPETGKTLPRGRQKYEFETVQRRAEKLGAGMTRIDVLMMLGSPAETSDDGSIWVYLPERPAVLVPSRALRLVFQGEVLVKHGYSPIILGQQL